MLTTLNAKYILTSYSTDGTIPLDEMLAANIGRGQVDIVMRGYKRYRVSSQRFSYKPLNVEFVLITNTCSKKRQTVDDLKAAIQSVEERVLAEHPEG